MGAALAAFERSMQVAITGLGEAAARAAHVDAARKALADAQAQNRAAAGIDLPFEQVVDGRIGAPLESVQVPGVILFRFGLMAKIARELDKEVQQRSPFRAKRPKAKPSTHFRDQFVWFADGAQCSGPTDPRIASAEELTLINRQPYARRVELPHRMKVGKAVVVRRLSPTQAPDGVLEPAGKAMAQRYPAVRFAYDFRAVLGNIINTSRSGNRSANRWPCLIITMR